MAEIRVTLRVGPRGVRWALVALLILAHAPESNPESVQLTTYYPSPSGVYFQMTTTDSAYFATGGGSVGIGTTAPASKLMVAGTGGTGGIAVTGETTNAFRAYGVGEPSAGSSEFLRLTHSGTLGRIEVERTGGATYRDLALFTGGSERLRILATGGTGGFVGIGVNPPTAMLQVGAVNDAQGIVKLGQTMLAGCNQQQSVNGYTCPAGQYITAMSGVYSNRQQLGYRPSSALAAVDFLCCPCPAGGCAF